MRLIDADALWMDIIHAMDYCDDILEFIDRMPEAVVRCKDCEYWDTEWTPEGAKDEPKECHWCRFIDLITNEDFFCAYGEVDDGNDDNA